MESKDPIQHTPQQVFTQTARTKGREPEALEYLSGCWAPPGTSGTCKRSCPGPSCVGSVAGSRHHGTVTAEKGELHCRLLAPKNWTLTTLAGDVTRGASLHYSPLCALICCNERKYLPRRGQPLLCASRETAAAPAYHLPPHLLPSL